MNLTIIKTDTTISLLPITMAITPPILPFSPRRTVKLLRLPTIRGVIASLCNDIQCIKCAPASACIQTCTNWILAKPLIWSLLAFNILQGRQINLQALLSNQGVYIALLSGISLDGCTLPAVLRAEVYGTTADKTK